MTRITTSGTKMKCLRVKVFPKERHTKQCKRSVRQLQSLKLCEAQVDTRHATDIRVQYCSHYKKFQSTDNWI